MDNDRGIIPVNCHATTRNRGRQSSGWLSVQTVGLRLLPLPRWKGQVARHNLTKSRGYGKIGTAVNALEVFYKFSIGG